MDTRSRVICPQNVYRTLYSVHSTQYRANENRTRRLPCLRVSRASARRSFAEGVEQLAVFGRSGAAVAGVAEVALIVADFAAGAFLVDRIAQAQAAQRF